MRIFILSSVLSISALIRKTSALTPRWRPWGRVQVSWSIIQRRCMFIQGCYLGMQLRILEVMLKEKISRFDEILLAVSKFPEPEKMLIQEVQTICKLTAVNPARALLAGIYSHLSARRLKTWFPSRMGYLAVLNGHKRRTDSISVATQEFVSHDENRKRNFSFKI